MAGVCGLPPCFQIGVFVMNDRRVRVYKNFSNGSRVVKTKIALSVVVIVLGAVVMVAISGMEKSEACHHSEGIIIDCGNYDTVWTHIDFRKETSDPVELLKIACEKNHATPTFKDGKLTEIKIGDRKISNDPGHEWGLWYINEGKCDFEKSDTYKIDASDYTVVSWAYTANGENPTVAVDALGTSIYDYPQPNSIVTLSPVCTEIVASVNKHSILTGRDEYSNYPESIKNVPVVGSYTGLSYESIMNEKHDVVFCDGSDMTQCKMARTLRDSNVNSVVIYKAKTLKDIIDNIFIVGTVTASDDRNTVIKNINKALNDIREDCKIPGYRTLVTLDSNPSPWVAGTDTYINDFLINANGSNAVRLGESCKGWSRITRSEIMNINPDCIIILDYGFTGKYEEMKESLSPEWKTTNAYKNEKIYLFTGDLGEIVQRAGPRIVQFAEIVAKTINPGAFKDDIPIPNRVGNDYNGYLKYTKSLEEMVTDHSNS